MHPCSCRKGKSTGTTDADLAAFRAEIEALDGVDGSSAQPNTTPATASQPQNSTDPTAAATAAHDNNDTAAPSTPEELEFEDDDGTWYVWHPTLRKYLAKGGDDTNLDTTNTLDPNSAASEAAAAAATDPATQSAGATLAQTGAASASVDEYDPEMMTYSAEDEVLPSLSDAKAAHEVARAIARGDDVGAPVGQASAAEQGAAKKGKVSSCADFHYYIASCHTGKLPVHSHTDAQSHNIIASCHTGRMPVHSHTDAREIALRHKNRDLEPLLLR